MLHSRLSFPAQVERLRPHTAAASGDASGHRAPSVSHNHSHHLKSIASGPVPHLDLDTPSPPQSPVSHGDYNAPLKYGSLGRASAPDLAALMAGGSSFVQRAGSYGGRVRRAVQRSPSMHKRMKQMLLKAKQRAVAQQRRWVASLIFDQEIVPKESDIVQLFAIRKQRPVLFVV